MVDITTLRSIGMIETGSHSIQEWEVMRSSTGEIHFISHDDGTEDEVNTVFDMFKTKNDESFKDQLATMNLALWEPS
jgi:hypothetical protein